MEFVKSNSYQNIINAYHGELVGEKIYQLLSEKLANEGNMELGQLFSKLAREENGHANVFKQLLPEGEADKHGLSAKEVEDIEKSFQDLIPLLEMYAAGEKKAGEEIYPQFSQIAADEGLADISRIFIELAKVELKHGNMLLQELDKLR